MAHQPSTDGNSATLKECIVQGNSLTTEAQTQVGKSVVWLGRQVVVVRKSSIAEVATEKIYEDRQNLDRFYKKGK